MSTTRVRGEHTLSAAALAILGMACSSAREDASSAPEPKRNEQLLTTTTTASAGAERRCAPKPPHHWKENTATWPVASLALGGTSYTAAQLSAILDLADDDDASVILGRQLVATLLDVASGTDPSAVTATIADANALLESATIPLHVPLFSRLGLRMLEDAATLDEFTRGRMTHACAPPVGACEAWARLSVLATGHDVVAYVAKGATFGPTATGIAVVNVEGTRVVPTLVPTPNIVNSCASNPLTGRTVCTANTTDVYLLSGTTLKTTLTSGAAPNLPSDYCANCGVTMDPIHDRALLAVSLMPFYPRAYQILDLGSSPSFEPVIESEVPDDQPISFGALIDPYRNRILSPTESNVFELIDVTPGASPSLFQRVTDGTEGGGEDCSTQIVLQSPLAFGPPFEAYVGMIDMSQATFTPGSPGSWNAPIGFYQLADSGKAIWGPVAVAQGTHTAVFAGTGATGNENVVAIALPTTSGSGTPAPGDYATCFLPSGTEYRPQPLTAYESPNSGDAIALIVSLDASTMAVVDLTKMSDPTIVPRAADGHTCAAGAMPASVLRMVSLP